MEVDKKDTARSLQLHRLLSCQTLLAASGKVNLHRENKDPPPHLLLLHGSAKYFHSQLACINCAFIDQSVFFRYLCSF